MMSIIYYILAISCFFSSIVSYKHNDEKMAIVMLIMCIIFNIFGLIYTNISLKLSKGE